MEASSVVELVKEEAVGILSEWQQVQGAIVQLTVQSDKFNQKSIIGKMHLQRGLSPTERCF